MSALIALLVLVTSTNATGFTDHGRAFTTLLTCAKHTIGFTDQEKQRLINLAFDLSDGAKALASDDDLSFVIGMTEQQEILAEQAAKAQRHTYSSLNAQISAYLDKETCLTTEQNSRALLDTLKQRLLK